MASNITTDALLYYRGVLEITRDVFGSEKMTDTVICQAVESAGNGIWNIMAARSEEPDEVDEETDEEVDE